jgi:hypothetical protein
VEKELIVKKKKEYIKQNKDFWNDILLKSDFAND